MRRINPMYVPLRKLDPVCKQLFNDPSTLDENDRLMKNDDGGRSCDTDPGCQNLTLLTKEEKVVKEDMDVDSDLPGHLEVDCETARPQRGIQLNRDNFCCSICLDLLKDPVTIPCGHSYCMSCIKGCWDEEDQKNVHSCPQCRQTFTPRPVLVKSTMFAAVVEEVKKTGLQAAPPDHCYAGPGDVACDVCTGRKLKALKSCLMCLASYCERHLQGHYDAPPLKKHQLVNPCKTLQENICSRHNEVMKVFCRTDQQCICYLCSMEEHKDHDTVSAAAERNQRQKELGVSLQNIQQMIQDREKDLKVLQQRVKAINRSADKAVEHSEKIFTEVKQQIRSRQEAEVHQAEELQKKMEQKIDELRRKVTEVQQLSHTEDSVHFLQNSSSLSGLSESTDLPTDVRPPRCFEDVSVAVSEVRDKVEGILKEEGSKISLTVTEDVLLSRPEPKTRDEFLQYSRQITLDPNTAHRRLLLSEGYRKATVVRTDQLYPHHPDRFTGQVQVLSREDLTGRCYFEVEKRGRGCVSIAVSHKNINRGISGESRFGCNDKSWSLDCFNNRYQFSHNQITTPAPGPQSSRVGVYLDHRAGVLSFYSVSGTMMTLLHRVQTSFTQTLCAGFGFYWSDRGSVELCELK
ncbi:tripartite motif-containing protein 16-like [Diretmus argenteus]